jgi:hypothetical protein
MYRAWLSKLHAWTGDRHPRQRQHATSTAPALSSEATCSEGSPSAPGRSALHARKRQRPRVEQGHRVPHSTARQDTSPIQSSTSAAASDKASASCSAPNVASGGSATRESVVDSTLTANTSALTVGGKRIGSSLSPEST